MSPISKDEQRWRRESDVRTLQDAEAIKQDPKRLRAAVAEAKRQAQALNKVTAAKKPAKKPTARRRR